MCAISRLIFIIINIINIIRIIKIIVIIIIVIIIVNALGFWYDCALLLHTE